MKVGIFAILALASIIGLAYGQLGLYPSASTGGATTPLMFFFLFFFLFFILNNRSRSVPLFVDNRSTGVNVVVSG